MQTHEKIRELLNDERTETKISLRIYGPKLSLMNVMCFDPSQWVASNQKTKPKQKFKCTPKCNILIVLVHVTKKFRALDIAGSRHLEPSIRLSILLPSLLASFPAWHPWWSPHVLTPSNPMERDSLSLPIIGQDHGLHLFDQFWICAFSEPIIVSRRKTYFDGVLPLSHECVCVRAGVGEVTEGQSGRKQGLYVALPKQVDRRGVCT